jgi:branched-chain amino acid transport system permease protein
MKRRNMLLSLIFLVFSLFLPLFLEYGYWLHIAIICFYYASLAGSWNLLAGFTGQFSFAHIGFAMVGAYTSGLLCVYLGLPVALGLIAGSLFAGFIGFLLGLLCLRLSGEYLLLASFAIAEIFRRIVINEYNITGGTVRGLKVPFLFGDFASPLPYYLMWGMMVATTVFVYLLLRSRFGLYLKSIREDEEASAVLGVNVVRWKLFSFWSSSVIAGLAGGLLGHYIGVVTPLMLGLMEMGLVTAMVVIGGIGTIIGPILGAALIEITSESIREVGLYRFLLFGVLMILVMKFAPDGIWGRLRKLYTRWRTRQAISRPLSKENTTAVSVRTDEPASNVYK